MLATCVAIWGTTWYVIKLQLGRVDPVASIVWRFAISGLMLLAINAFRREPVRLTARQHGLAFGQGISVFALGYYFVYVAEAHAPSALVAVLWALLALVNLVLFALVYRQVSKPLVWAGAGLGAVGVALLSAGQIAASAARADLALGVGFSLLAVLVNAVGNLFTRAGQAAGADIILSTGAAMLYGTGALVLFGLATHVNFAIPTTLAYLGPLLYLSALGSVAGFVFYYRLARSAGFTTASYIGAMTPLIAMLVSTVMEHVEWTKAAFAGVVLILVGQALVLRNSNPKA